MSLLKKIYDGLLWKYNNIFSKQEMANMTRFYSYQSYENKG